MASATAVVSGWGQVVVDAGAIFPGAIGRENRFLRNWRGEEIGTLLMWLPMI